MSLPETAPQSLFETLSQSLETMAFVMADPLSAPADAPGEPLVVSLSFTGPHSGTIDIVAGREFAMMLAANVLGTDPSDHDAQEKADDCMKELVNVVGGALMPRIATSNTDVFKLSLPTTRPLDVETEWPRLCADQATQLANADGHVIAARIAA